MRRTMRTCNLILFILILSSYIVDLKATVIDISSINVFEEEKENKTRGSWRNWSNCDEGKFLKGLFMNIKSKKNFKIIQLLKMKCEKPGLNNGNEGEWEMNLHGCHGFIIGFQLKINTLENKKNQSIVTNLRVYCSENTSFVLVQSNDMGIWMEPKLCGSKEAVCGIRTMKKTPLTGDDLLEMIGTNYTKWIKCCAIDEVCFPSDKWEVVFEIDNSFGPEPINFAFSKKIGVSFEKVKYRGSSKDQAIKHFGDLNTKYESSTSSPNIDLVKLPFSKLISMNYDKGSKRITRISRHNQLDRKDKSFVSISFNVNIPVSNGDNKTNVIDSLTSQLQTLNLYTSTTEQVTTTTERVENEYETKNDVDERMRRNKEIERLGTIFKKKISSSNTTGFNWETASIDTWAPMRQTSIDITVDPGHLVTLYQVIGTCGNFKVRAEKFFQNGTFTEVQKSTTEKITEEPVTTTEIGVFSNLDTVLSSVSSMFQDVLNVARKISATNNKFIEK